MNELESLEKELKKSKALVDKKVQMISNLDKSYKSKDRTSKKNVEEVEVLKNRIRALEKQIIEIKRQKEDKDKMLVDAKFL